MSLINDEKDWADPDTEPMTAKKFALKVIRIGFLLLLWSFFTIVLLGFPLEHIETTVVTILPNQTLVQRLNTHSTLITLKGHINDKLMKIPKGPKAVNQVTVQVEWQHVMTNKTIQLSDMWNVHLLNPRNVKFVEVSRLFEIDDKEWRTAVQAMVSLRGDCEHPVCLVMVTEPRHIFTNYGIVYAVFLLLGLYIIIAFELTDPTFGALLMASTALATLTVLGNRPTLRTITTWLDFRTLMLIMALTIIVEITSETGFFDLAAVQIYRTSKGYPWLLVIVLGTITGLMSTVLDNLTVVLVVAPIAVRLCEAVRVQAPLVILVVVMYSNMGEALTPLGDPTTMLIAAHTGVNFANFVLHMLPGVMGALLVSPPVTYLAMRTKLHRLDARQLWLMDEREAERPRMSAEVARRASWLRRHQKLRSWIRPAPKYFETLAFLQTDRGVQDQMLLAKCLAVWIFVLIGFLLQSLSVLPGASLWSVAILGAFLLIILAKLDDMEWVIRSIDWSAFLFLAAHFVLMGVLDQLGLIRWLGDGAFKLIASVEEPHQTRVTILLVIWLTAISSALINNVTVTKLFLKVIQGMVETNTINVPLSPLIWALSYGACFGANGSIFGSYANVIGMIVARRFGYRITCLQFFRYGTPVMLLSLTVASVYLLIAHSAYKWD